MIGDTIIHKTALGLGEMETRTRRISPLLRAVLIMIDGKSSSDELYQKVSTLPQYSDQAQFEKNIETLLAEGLISSVSDNTESVFALQDNLPAAEIPTDWSPDFAIKMKRKLMHTAGEILDKQAKKVINKLEKAPNSKEGVVVAINDSIKLVRLFIDEKKADDLERSFSALIGESSWTRPFKVATKSTCLTKQKHIDYNLGLIRTNILVSLNRDYLYHTDY